MRWTGPIIPETGEECCDCDYEAPCSKEHRGIWEAIPVAGAPTKCTRAKRAGYLKAIAKGASDRMARGMVGWSDEVFVKWRREVREGRAPGFIVKFFEKDIPEAKTKLYQKALEAIDDGLGNEDLYKRAEVGFKILDKLYGPELNLAPTSVRHEGSSGGPVEFRIVMDGAPLPPKIAERGEEQLEAGEEPPEKSDEGGTDEEK